MSLMNVCEHLKSLSLFCLVCEKRYRYQEKAREMEKWAVEAAAFLAEHKGAEDDKKKLLLKARNLGILEEKR